MAAILRDAGLRVYVGRYSIRVEDCSHFVFQEYGGDLGDPVVDAFADSVEQMLREASLVSRALANADVAHRFEVYCESTTDMVGYLHHDSPIDGA